MITWDDIRSKYEKVIEDSLGPVISVDEIILKIIQRRLALGLTQTEVARRAGIKQSAVARLESFSIIPRLDTLIVMLEALDLEINIEARGKRNKQIELFKRTPNQQESSSSGKVVDLNALRNTTKARAQKTRHAPTPDDLLGKKRPKVWTHSMIFQEGKVKTRVL